MNLIWINREQAKMTYPMSRYSLNNLWLRKSGKIPLPQKVACCLIYGENGLHFLNVCDLLSCSLLLSGWHKKIFEYHRQTCLNSMGDSMLRLIPIKAEDILPLSLQIWNWGMRSNCLSMISSVHKGKYLNTFLLKDCLNCIFWGSEKNLLPNMTSIELKELFWPHLICNSIFLWLAELKCFCWKEKQQEKTTNLVLFLVVLAPIEVFAGKETGIRIFLWRLACVGSDTDSQLSSAVLEMKEQMDYMLLLVRTEVIITNSFLLMKYRNWSQLNKCMTVQLNVLDFI